MAEWTNQELAWTYDYAKRVYEKQLSKSDAQDWLKGQMPSRSRDSLGMYIDDLLFMLKGDAIKRSASRAMFEFFLNKIYEDYPEKIDNAFVSVCGYIAYDYSATGNMNKPLKAAIEQLAVQLGVDISSFNPYKDEPKKKESVWWPSLDEYNPGLSKEQWLETLNDGVTFTENALSAIAEFYDYGGEATCAQLAEKYGRTSDFYRNSLGVKLAGKVKDMS